MSSVVPVSCRMAALSACTRLGALRCVSSVHITGMCARGAVASGSMIQGAWGSPVATTRIAHTSAVARRPFSVAAGAEEAFDGADAGEQPVDWTSVLPDNLMLHNPQDALPEETQDYCVDEVKTVPLVKFNAPGATAGAVTLDNRVFGVPIRPDIVHRVVQWQLANRRYKQYKTKTISETRGGGRKPWAQKHTGRARAGSIRSAHWRGGAKAHGPKIREWSQKLNKKIRRQGLAIALAAKAQERRVVVVDEFNSKSHKTREVASLIEEHGWDEHRLLLIDDEFDPTFALASANIKRVNLLPVAGVNVFDIVKMDVVVVSQDGLQGLYDRLLGGDAPELTVEDEEE